jgi:hypothetical protein
MNGEDSESHFRDSERAEKDRSTTAADTDNDCSISVLAARAAEYAAGARSMPAKKTRATKNAKTRRLEALVAALTREFKMQSDDATAIAEIVAERFAEDDEVNDDNLDAEIRSIFYTLESKKLLSFRREEYQWENGEHRRAFYWKLREEALMEEALPAPPEMNNSVYDTLPVEAWKRPVRAS